MTLNGVMAVILRYFSEFGYLPGVLRKSSPSLSHLLMSSCTFCSFTVFNELNERLIAVWSDFRQDIIDIALTSAERVSRHVSVQMVDI